MRPVSFCNHNLGDLEVRAVAVVLLSLKICDVTEYKQKSVEQQQRLSLRDHLKCETRRMKKLILKSRLKIYFLQQLSIFLQVFREVRHVFITL